METIKMMNTVQLVALSLALTSSNLLATTISFKNAKSGSVGNTQAGASYTFNGEAYGNDSASVNEAYVRIWGAATAKLLGQSETLANVDAKVSSKKNAGNLTVLVKACGYNVVNQSTAFNSGTTKSYSKSYSSTFLTAQSTVWVSVVPVTFKGNVGGGASMNLTYSIGPLRADMGGAAKAWGTTTAKAGLGIGGYTLAGVGTSAKLLETSLNTTAGIGFLSGQKKGSIDLSITPLYADLWCQVLNFPKKTVAQWSTPSYSYNLCKIR